MIHKTITLISIIIFFLCLISCKRDTKSGKNINNSSEKKISTNIKEQTVKKQEKPIDYLEKFIGRKELDIYKGENEIIWGEFYSPESDSLLIFKFSPKNIKSKELVKHIETLPENEQAEKQIIILTNLEDFNILIRKVDYEYVIEQQDAGGASVFNVKKPFKAQDIISKDGKLVMGKVKTYEQFSEIY